MEHGVRVFEVHEKTELPSESDEELHQLVTAASAANRSAVVLFFSPSRAPPHLPPCAAGVYYVSGWTVPLVVVSSAVVCPPLPQRGQTIP